MIKTEKEVVNDFTPCVFCHNILIRKDKFHDREVGRVGKDGRVKKILTEAKTIEMLERFAINNERPKDLAKEYGLSKSAFYSTKCNYKKKIMKNACIYLDKHGGNTGFLARILGITLEEANNMVKKYRNLIN